MKGPFKRRQGKTSDPSVSTDRFVWMGSGALPLEGHSTKQHRLAVRADKGGKSFSASYRWLALHAKHVLGGQILTVAQYEVEHGSMEV